MEEFADNARLIVLIAAVALLPFAFILDRRRREKRTEKYRRLGLKPIDSRQFREWARPGNFSILEKMGIFNRQHEHVMGEYKGHRVALFTHSVGDGSKSGKHQTAVMIELSKAGPGFVLRPEWLRDKLKSGLGYPDIDFEDDPQFSRRYFLQGEQEPALKAIFNHKVRDRLGKETGLWVESDGEKLLTFKEHKQLIDGTRLESMLDRAIDIKGLIEGSAG